MTENIKEKSCGVIPVFKENGALLFLLVKHKGGHWGFPKGHVELGESEEQTATRELNEEVGISRCELIKDFKYSQTYTFYRKDIGKITKEAVFFLGLVESTKGIRIQEEELTGYGWFDYNETLEKIYFEGNKKMTRVAMKYLNPKITH